MDMDLDISRWVLEFLVRKGIDDHLLKQVLSTLPLPDNSSSRWKKTMLLRTIYSEILDGSVTEKMLDLLEMIAEVDKREGYVIFETMKSAYCAVAVDCTVRFMEENGNCVGKYFNAVERIWRGRIGNMEKLENVDLISDQLRSWMDEIEAAVWDDEVCKKIIARNTRNEALKSVRVYVTEAWKVMGPTFLELVAKKMGKSLMESQKSGKHRSFGQVGDRPTSLPNAVVGVCNEFNTRDTDQAGERAVSSSNAHQDLGVSADRTTKDETQVVYRGRTCSEDVGGSNKLAAINENQVEHIAIPRPKVGGDVGVVNEPARRDACQFKITTLSKSNARYELGASRRPSIKFNDYCGDRTSSVHQNLGGSAKPANTVEISVEDIGIRLPDVNGDSADVQAKRNKCQIQEKASTSFDASRDWAIDDRPTMKDKYRYIDGVTTFPRQLGGSSEPTITNGNQVEDIAPPLLNGGVELGLSDELIKRDKVLVEERAATLSSSSQDWVVRERSIMKQKDQCGEGAANYCQDSSASTKSANPVENQATAMAVPLNNACGKSSVTDELTVSDKDHDEERATMALRGPALREKEVENGNVLPKRKYVAGHGKRSRRGIKIADIEELSMETSSNKFDFLPSPEVYKVQEALRSSSLELRAVVKDPLPNALSLAAAVLCEMRSKHINHEPSVETHDRMDVDVPSPSVDESVEAAQAGENIVLNLSSGHQNDDSRPGLIEETLNKMDANPPNSFVNKRSGAVRGNEDNPGNRHQNNDPRPSLMAHNSTARTYEWDDSIDNNSHEGPSCSRRLHLTSPKRKAVSPLKKYEPAKFVRRRKRWSTVEEDTLRTGVQKYGRGNWKLILNSYRQIFEERTEVDLKDKWRNLMK